MRRRLKPANQSILEINPRRPATLFDPRPGSRRPAFFSAARFVRDADIRRRRPARAQENNPHIRNQRYISFNLSSIVNSCRPSRIARSAEFAPRGHYARALTVNSPNKASPNWMIIKTGAANNFTRVGAKLANVTRPTITPPRLRGRVKKLVITIWITIVEPRF